MQAFLSVVLTWSGRVDGSSVLNRRDGIQPPSSARQGHNPLFPSSTGATSSHPRHPACAAGGIVGGVGNGDSFPNGTLSLLPMPVTSTPSHLSELRQRRIGRRCSDRIRTSHRHRLQLICNHKAWGTQPRTSEPEELDRPGSQAHGWPDGTHLEGGGMTRQPPHPGHQPHLRL